MLSSVCCVVSHRLAPWFESNNSNKTCTHTQSWFAPKTLDEKTASALSLFMQFLPLKRYTHTLAHMHTLIREISLFRLNLKTSFDGSRTWAWAIPAFMQIRFRRFQILCDSDSNDSKFYAIPISTIPNFMRFRFQLFQI